MRLQRSTVIGAALVFAVAAAVAAALLAKPRTVPVAVDASGVRGEASVAGTLRISHFGAGSSPGEPLLHTSTYVKGAHYAGMEDNDIRGFLDGAFKWGWNQSGQVHLRVGRRGDAPRFGEDELFRILQRWDGIVLPAKARVANARLDFHLEETATRPVSLLLYAVMKDWNPGGGVEKADNHSPPRPGEVWWNETARGERSWGLPGAGYAAAGDSTSDTDPMPLAEARYEPGDSVLSFSSDRLAAYVAERAAAGKPLLFLIKQTDDDEDTPGALLFLISADNDNDLNSGRRPRLVVQWQGTGERRESEWPVFLEHGRTYRIPREAVTGSAIHALTFAPQERHSSPSLMVRGGTGRDTSAWQAAAVPIRANWEWMETTVLAASNPLTLGSAFRQEIRNAWIQTAPPEEQKVPWVFVSPTGVTDTVLATYRAPYRWEVVFTPDEVGHWTYSWSNNFIEQTYRSPVGSFDVMVGDRDNARIHLARFAQRVREPGADVRRLALQFLRLERAIMQHETPASYRSPEGEKLRATLNEIRGKLGGELVPSPIPLVADAPPAWAAPRPGFVRRQLNRVRGWFR